MKGQDRWITCDALDGGCGEDFHSDQGAETFGSIEKRARAEGWQIMRADRHLCPEHAK